MSYRVDSKSMLFDDLLAFEAEKLLLEVQELVIRGTNVHNTEAFQSWQNACQDQLNPNWGLMMMATVYPQRALLSIALLQQKKLSESTETGVACSRLCRQR